MKEQIVMFIVGIALILMIATTVTSVVINGGFTGVTEHTGIVPLESPEVFTSHVEGDVTLFSDQSHKYEVERITIVFDDGTKVIYPQSDWKQVIVEVTK